MSGELFHTPLKMKINCSSVFMWRAGSKFTFSPFPDSFAYLLIFHVFLSVGHWTLGFLFTLADVVLWCQMSIFARSLHWCVTCANIVTWWFSVFFIPRISWDFYGIITASVYYKFIFSVLCCNANKIMSHSLYFRRVWKMWFNFIKLSLLQAREFTGMSFLHGVFCLFDLIWFASWQPSARPVNHL